MGLSGEFSFEEDTPHLLWIFRDGLGYTDEEVKDKILKYLYDYRFEYTNKFFKLNLYLSNI